MQITTTGTQPVQPNVSVDAFVMDAYEVTVARFRRFWAAGHPAASPVLYPNDASVVMDGVVEEPATGGPYTWTSQPGANEDRPVNRVTWNTAFAFCAWDGGRLPTEAEWEFTATSRPIPGLPTPRLYPWGGAAPNCGFAHYDECSGAPPSTASVTQISPIGGIYHLAGNVTEWTADYFDATGQVCWDGTPKVDPLCLDPSFGVRTIKGGSFTSSSSQLAGAWRYGGIGVSGSRGIRCVRDVLMRDASEISPPAQRQVNE
jgi:formylglycine-generating enzyme required for sulfatase activity